MASRIVFMGTPDFAVASLKLLIEAGEMVVGVVTAPDKPSGRGQKIKSSPVKEFAEKQGIPVFQPLKLKDQVFIEELKALEADIFVVVAFRMLPEVIWRIPPLGTFNLHASLLPQYRGAAPINWALINGETETGVTTFLIDDKIDTGKIILQEKVRIDEDMNAGKLHDILMTKGAELVLKTIRILVLKTYDFTSQESVISSLSELKPAPKIFKESCRINWNTSSRDVHNFIRGLSPYPAAWTVLVNEQNELLQTRILEAAPDYSGSSGPAGKIDNNDEDELIIYCRDGAILVSQLHPSGKNRMGAREFLLGYRKKLVRAE